MTKIKLQSGNDVAETLLIALYARAQEARQPAPLILDARAADLVEQIDYDFARTRLQGHDQVFTVMRVRSSTGERRTSWRAIRRPWWSTSAADWTPVLSASLSATLR